MDDLFHGARRKIKRADQHIVHLSEVFDSFLKSDFHEISIKKNSETGQHWLEVAVHPMPEDVPLILGDALHNLRTSLDFVSTAITRAAGKSVDYCKFPFRKTREEVIAAINGGLKETAPSSVISAIVDEVKPYKGGNDALYTLHDLDIKDKHLLIVPTISIATIKGVSFTFGGLLIQNSTFIVEGGQKIRFEGPPSGPEWDLQIQNKGKPSCEVIFPEINAFYMEPVIPTLHKLSQLVSVCVDTIAEAYQASV